MKEAIDKLGVIGLKILVIMSDQRPNFHSLVNHVLEPMNQNPWFIHNNKKYFVMFDPPHLIKSIRNNLKKYSFHFEKDKSLPIKAAPKLTEKHIHPNNFCKMKVKLATQVFSHTVAFTICTYVSVGALPSSAMGTAKLLSKFDSLIVSTVQVCNSAKKFKCALNDTSPHIGHLEEIY